MQITYAFAHVFPQTLIGSLQYEMIDDISP